MKETKRKPAAKTPAASPVYIMGGIGALIYYISVAHGFGGIIVACLKAIVWPAFVTHDLLQFMA